MYVSLPTTQAHPEPERQGLEKVDERSGENVPGSASIDNKDLCSLSPIPDFVVARLNGRVWSILYNCFPLLENSRRPTVCTIVLTLLPTPRQRLSLWGMFIKDVTDDWEKV